MIFIKPLGLFRLTTRRRAISAKLSVPEISTNKPTLRTTADYVSTATSTTADVHATEFARVKYE